MLKFLNVRSIEKKKVCGICYESCEGMCKIPFCMNEKEKDKNKYCDLNFIYFDYTNDLKVIVERYWQVILEYKMILNSGSYSDIQNGTSKQICHNSISLVLFVDGAHFNKNAEGVVWAGMVSNLPFTIRASSALMKTF